MQDSGAEEGKPRAHIHYDWRHFVLVFVITGCRAFSGQEVYIVYLAQFKTCCNGSPLQIIKSLKKWGIARLLDYRKPGRLSAGSSVSRSPRAGCVCEAPLAALVLDDVGGGAALVPARSIAAAGGGCQVLSAAAEEATRQVLEQVTGKEHVDPGVTAAVEAGKQHGDDEGHVCGKTQRRAVLF